MVGPDWALVVLIVYPLVQIPLVYYLARRFELDGDAPILTPTRAYWTGRVADDQFGESADARPWLCRRCGTANEPGFDFCANCVAPLS